MQKKAVLCSISGVTSKIGAVSMLLYIAIVVSYMEQIACTTRFKSCFFQTLDTINLSISFSLSIIFVLLPDTKTLRKVSVCSVR